TRDSSPGCSRRRTTSACWPRSAAPECADPSHLLARKRRGLPHPVPELLFVEPVLGDVVVTHLRMFRGAGRLRRQRSAAEERHLHVAREAVEAQEPEAVLHAIEGRVPFDGLADTGNCFP